MRIDDNIQAFSQKLSFNKEHSIEKTYEANYFGKFFNEAVELINKTNTMQKNAEEKQIDFITGKSDDMIGLIMAQERANSAVQFTSQVTNKILNIYQEIMRIAI